ncbi:hypothetical protein WJX73_009336 [Symbiochloris irregularis]|uniref:RING-CH-type domain-containing protein n=1 Tax=Symbiochloris irregularis TaxID=706552 RepID=A0AAW1P8R2_9CHLO
MSLLHEVQPVSAEADGQSRRKRNTGESFSFAANCAEGQASCSVEVPQDAPVCWICLDGPSSLACLVQPCRCPRFAHAHCLARWQLQSAGSRKETHCEFCDSELPDWKATLTPKCGADAPAVMNVNFDGRTYSFEVKPGADGYRNFTEAIRKAFLLPEDSELNITFTCDEPGPCIEPSTPPTVDRTTIKPPAPVTHVGPLLTLQGAGAYDAAVHCASVSAARRILQSAGSPEGQPAVVGQASIPPLDPGALDEQSSQSCRLYKGADPHHGSLAGVPIF